MKETIERIRRMERLFDEVRSALADGKDMQPLQGKIKALERYMTDGQWLLDYERDERGVLPVELVRGVLSQDALYDLLAELDEKEKMR